MRAISLRFLAGATALLFIGVSSGGNQHKSAESLPPGAKAQFGTPSMRIPPGLYYADLTSAGEAVGYLDARDYLKFTDLRTGTVRTGPRLQAMPQARVSFAPDGNRVATTDQNEIVVWNAHTFRRVATVKVRGLSRPQMWAPVSFSADGKRIAVGWGRKGSASVFVVWDVERDQLVTEVIATAVDRPLVALSCNGKRLATWGYRKKVDSTAKTDPLEDSARTITLWDVDAGKPAHRVVCPGPVSGRVCFSPDDKTLAIVGREIEFRDTTRWEVRARAEGRVGNWPSGNAVVFSPDGKRLAILYADGTVDLRDTATADRIALVKGHAPGSAIRFPDNDRAVVLGGGEHVCCAWEVPSGDLLTPPPAHLEKVRQVVFTPDGKHLLSLSEDGVLIRWDVTAGKPVPGGGLLPADYAGWTGTDELLEYISPDATRAVFGKPYSGAVRVFDLQSRKEILAASRRFDMTWVPNVSCSPRGTRMILNTGMRNGYPADARPNTVWDITSGRKLFDFPQRDSRDKNAFFSPDDQTLVVLLGRYDSKLKQEGVAGQVWHGVTGKQLVTFEAAGMIGDFTAGVSPNGRTLVVSSRGRQVSIFDLPSARLRLKAAPSKHAPRSAVVLSPDGRQFAIGQTEVGDSRGYVQVWETVSGTVRHTLDGHRLATPTVAFSTDGCLLASGSEDATVILWDLWTAPIPAEVLAASSEWLWDRLGWTEAAEAYPAMLMLIRRPADAIAVITRNLQPAREAAVGPAQINELIARLGADGFRDRETAAKALTNLGREGEMLLKDALARSSSLETRQRLESILAAIKLGPTREQILAARAVEVLERIGTTEAQAVLRRLVGGRPDHPLTQDAKTALDRLAR